MESGASFCWTESQMNDMSRSETIILAAMVCLTLLEHSLLWGKTERKGNLRLKYKRNVLQRVYESLNFNISRVGCFTGTSSPGGVKGRYFERIAPYRNDVVTWV